MRSSVLSGMIVLILSSTVFAQKPTGKRWLDMNYGPYLTASIESAVPERNIAQKGIAIRLGKDKDAAVVFDTDLLRYSIGWTGDFLNLRGVVYDGSHGTWPSVAGRQVFGTRYRPGWSFDGNFEDPRTKYQGKGYGPLKHDHARYKGLYLHGQRVILSYTVGQTPILDTPGWRHKDDIGIFTRAINVAPSKKDLILSVLDHNGPLSIVNAKSLKPTGDSADIQDSTVFQGDIAKLTASPSKKPSKPADNGLLAHWSFDENKGDKASPSKGKLVALLNKARWTAGKTGSGLAFAQGQQAVIESSEKVDLSNDFSITAWVKTKQGGTILSKTTDGKWVHHGKTFFVRGGRLCFDIGWVGVVQSSIKVHDGQWHQVAVTYRKKDGAVNLYVDGRIAGRGSLSSVADPKDSVLRLGYTSTNFPQKGNRSLVGALDEVRIYNRTLSPEEFGVKTSPMVVAVRANASREGLKWKTKDGQLQLHIPASNEATRIEIAVGVSEGAEPSKLSQALAFTKKPEDLTPLTKGGPPRWKELQTTTVKQGTGDGPWVADTLTPPRDNPWKSWMRFGGFDFFKDSNRAAICTWSGDVWIVTGVDAMKKLTWQRIASGMFQPLGLKIVNEQIYVTCRDQITRLHDLNGDGEADFYESFNNDHQVTEHFHEFAMDLQTDAKGNFYYAKSARHALPPVVPHHGTLIRVSPDGKKSEMICNGFRAANGVGIGPNGEMMTSDQEGHWMPANRLNLVKPRGFYGNLYSFQSDKRTEKEGYDPPLCWLPKNVDRSPAEQLWVTSKKWGPLEGRMIHTSYGTGQIFLVMHETVNGVPQGGVVPLPGLRFPTGVMRARFHPKNGQLYVCGLVGWSSNCALPGDFYRIRYTDKKVHLPVELKVQKDGIALTFTEPLDRASAEDIDNYALEQWNYRWTKNYGSKHYRVSNPKRTGQDEVDVEEAKLSKDGRTLLLKIDNLQPVMQMKIAFAIKAKDGSSVRCTIHNTINQIPK